MLLHLRALPQDRATRDREVSHTIVMETTPVPQVEALSLLSTAGQRRVDSVPSVSPEGSVSPVCFRAQWEVKR